MAAPQSGSMWIGGAWVSPIVEGSSAPTVPVVVWDGRWPSRPQAAGVVEWRDPSGAAPLPPSGRRGDIFITADTSIGQVRPSPLLTYADTQLTSDNWWVAAGAPVLDKNSGTISLPSASDKASRGDVAVEPGATVRVSVTPQGASSGSWSLWIDWLTPARGYISGLTAVRGAGSTVASGEATVPTEAGLMSVTLVGGPATIESVSVEQVI